MRNSLLPSTRKNSPKSACRPERIGAGISTPVIVKSSETDAPDSFKNENGPNTCGQPVPEQHEHESEQPTPIDRPSIFPSFCTPDRRGEQPDAGTVSCPEPEVRPRERRPVRLRTLSVVGAVGPVVCRNAPRADNSFERNSLSLAVYLELRHERLERTEIHPRQRRPGT